MFKVAIGHPWEQGPREQNMACNYSNCSYPRLPTRREARQEEDVDDVDDEGEWLSSFCGCLDDPPSCLLTAACPCVAAGLVAHKLERGTTTTTTTTKHWLTGALVWLILEGVATFGCLYSCHYRRQLRKRHNLPNLPLPDPLVHWVCWPCAICQELRELKARETTYYGFGDDDDRTIIFAAPGTQLMGSR